MTPNETTPRWLLGVPGGLQQSALAVFRALERTLGRLHGRVEHPAPSAEERVACTVDTAINATSATAITGATVTITPEVAGRFVVHAEFSVIGSLFAAVTQKFLGMLFVNGAEIATAERAVASVGALNFGTTVGQVWTVAATANVAYTLDLRAATENVATTYTAKATHTGFVVLFFPTAYSYPQ